MHRRTYVTTVGGLGVCALAGCLGEFGDDGADEDEREGGDDENGGDSTDDDHEAVATVEAYLAAAQDGNEEAMATLAHEDSPANPEWVESMETETDGDDGWTLRDTEAASIEDVEVELLAEDVVLADVTRVQHLEFWFEEEDLELIDGDGTALVRTEWVDTDPDGYGYPDEVVEVTEWVLFTADGEWTILWLGQPHGTPEDFADPVTDEEGRLVDSIEYSVQELEGEEFADRYGGNEIHRAEVTFVDDPDPAIDAARIESTVALGHAGVEPANTVTYLTVDVAPDGDEVTVYAIVDGEQEVVHREHYEP